MAKEWSDRNLPLTPDQVMPFSRKKLWWRCPFGHEWQATANSRSRGSSCTICQNKKVVPGLNDLPTRYPKLISEWGDNNGTLTLDQLRPKDLATRVWWKCGTCGNEYLQLISSKVYRDSKCPYCTGRKLIPGFNDLETTHPELAAEWDGDANTEYTPQEVTWISRKYVWWRCPCGHSWGCKLRERTMEQKNCVVCSAELRAVLPGWLLILTAEKLGLEIMVSANTENGMAFDLLLPKVKIAADIGCVSVEGRSRQTEKERNAKGCGYHYTALPISSDLAVITHAVDSVFAKCGFPIAWDLTEDATTLKERFSQIRKETNNTGKDENAMDDELKKLLLKVILSEEVSTQAGQNVAPTKKKMAPEPLHGIDQDPNAVITRKKDPKVREQVEVDLQNVQADMYTAHSNNIKELKGVPIWEKYALTVNEAAQYFHIGVRKLRAVINQDRYANYLIWNGGRVFIKRKMFEEYLDREIQL